MTDTPMPANPEDWSSFLTEKPLPSPFRIGSLVLKNMKQNSLPYHKIADQLSHDPVLAFRIMNSANAERPTGNPCSKTLDHAISMIGTEELKSLIESLPFQDSSSEDIKSFYYVRTLSSSLYAGHLAAAIARKKDQGNPEDLYWSSLFLGVPVWYMWRHATPEMRLIRYAIRSNFKLPAEAEQEVLGCTMLELCNAVVSKLSLPTLVHECYESSRQLSRSQWIQMARLVKGEDKPWRIEDRELAIATQQPHFIVMLANMVAHYATHDWYSRSALRSQKIVAAYLGIPLSDAIRLTHEAAADMSREHPLPGVMLPAAKLFLEPRGRKKAVASAAHAQEKHSAADGQGDKTQKTESSASTEAKTRAPVKPNGPPEGLFKELSDIMIHRPGEFVDLHELMNAATQALSYGLDLQRVTVSLINKDDSRLRTYYSVGCREQSEMANFETPIVGSTIFKKLTEKPASLWVRGSTNQRVLDLIPSNFKQVIEVDEYFLMSVFVGKKAVAIFYADQHLEGGLNEWQYKYFKFLCGAVTHALNHQAKEKKKARSG